MSTYKSCSNADAVLKQLRTRLIRIVAEEVFEARLALGGCPIAVTVDHETTQATRHENAKEKTNCNVEIKYVARY